MKSKRKMWRGVILRMLSFIVLVAPFGVLIYMKRDVWFIHGADKIGYGLMMLLAFAIAMITGALKDMDKRFGTLVALAIMGVVSWLLSTIMVDLWKILACASAGYAGYLLLDNFAKRDLGIYKSYRDEKARVEARVEAHADIEETSANIAI